MLVKFTVKNYKTFKEKAELSMVASNYDKYREDENVISIPEFDLRLLKTAVIYGANASGKSKLMEAFRAMKRLVRTSAKENQKGDPISVEPFLLNSVSEKQPSEFEVIFYHANQLFRYGFEADRNRVISEWLYHKPNTKEVELFYREGQEFKIHSRSFSKGRMLVKEGFVKENTLMLSAAAQWNDEKAGLAFQWFNSFGVISGLNEDGYAGYTLAQTKNPKKKQNYLEFLNKADLDIHGFTLEKMELEKLPKDLPKELRDIIETRLKDEKEQLVADVLTEHRKYDENKLFVDNVNFSLRANESSGTRKFFFLSGPLLDVLNRGTLMVIDELDSKLHPNLVCKITEIFNSNDLNKNNAQLIFNTHDTNLLSSGMFRRDQIWFTEKNRYGEATLYSLSDFKTDTVRKEDNFERNYIQGKYGAIPFFGDFNKLLNSNVITDEDEEQVAGAN